MHAPFFGGRALGDDKAAIGKRVRVEDFARGLVSKPRVRPRGVK